MCHIIIKHKGNDFLAQLVEQLTLNQWVEGSSPSGVTKFEAQLLFNKAVEFFVKGICGA